MKKLILGLFLFFIVIGIAGFVLGDENNTSLNTTTTTDLNNCMIITSGHELNLGVLSGKNLVSIEECNNMITTTDGNKIKDYVCSNEKGVQNITFRWGISTLASSTYDCSKVCTDSDGGINYNVKGTTHYGDFDYEDWCSTSDNVVNQGQSNEYTLKKGDLMEYACYGEDGQFRCTDTACRFIQYHCPNGCSDGACIQGTTTTCESIKCSDGSIAKCKSNGNICSCESCPSVPMDMDSCLSNPNNYWDQETDSCKKGYSKEIIKYTCSDPDGGRNYFQYAHTYGFRSYSSSSDPGKDLRIRTGGADYCDKKTGQLSEMYCDENGFIQQENFQCPNGCLDDGACLKGEPISEKITCKFEGTNSEQQCYLAGQWGPDDIGTKFCKADSNSGSCVISYTGYKGEQVTWKSSCGQYQYTTQDGNDEVIYFKCSEGETTTTQIQNKGFKFAYWQCYDGTEQKSEDTSSCKLSETWQKYAKDYCNNKCNGEKCGVNSFSVSQECYTDEVPATEVSGIGVGINSTEPILDPESLVCKDSCPLDNKCYPFGYRKGGNYCSDDSKFVLQLPADKSCENNFECSSNICISGKCISESLLDKIFKWFSSLFGN